MMNLSGKYYWLFRDCGCIPAMAAGIADRD
jgi:hypothetical protein